jgi:hypothetical protein
MDPDPLRPPVRRGRLVPYLWMAAAAVALVVMLVQAWTGGPFDPAGRERMANYPGDLRTFLVRGVVELLVLALVLRVWSYRHAPGRAALALVLWLPWAALNSVACMHCGPVGGAHALWLLGVGLGLLVTLIVSLVARVRSRRTPSSRAPSIP